LTRFATVFPTRRDDGVSREHYNRLTAREVENIRDFLVFHYHVNGRIGEPLWDELRHMAVPDSLSEKIALFRARGLTQFPDQTVFQEENWMAVMLGQGLMPQAHDPLIDGLPEAALYATLDAIRRDCHRAVERMPAHADALHGLARRRASGDM